MITINPTPLTITRCPQVRRAFTIIEVVVAVFLLAACLVAYAQLRTTLITQQSRLNTTDVARLQLQNVFEIIGKLPPDELRKGDFSAFNIESLIANTLPAGEIKFEVTPVVFRDQQDGEVTVHLLKSTVFWEEKAGHPKRSLSLVRLIP